MAECLEAPAGQDLLRKLRERLIAEAEQAERNAQVWRIAVTMAPYMGWARRPQKEADELEAKAVELDVVCGWTQGASA